MYSPIYAIPLDSGTPEEIVTAIEAAVENKTKDKKTIQALQKALSNSKSPIRIREHAAWALGELEHRPSVNYLVEAAKHKGLLIRSAALNALMHMRARTALPVYIDIAKNDPVLLLRQRATLAMGLLRWDDAINPLVELSEDPKVEIRGACALAMGALHSDRNDFTEILTEMRGDESPYVQVRALRALRVTQRKNKTVRTHISEDDADIRLMGALYLHYHGSKWDLQAIKNQLKVEKDPEVRYELTQASLAINKRIKRAEEKKKKELAKKKAAEEAARKAAAKKSSSSSRTKQSGDPGSSSSKNN